MAWIESYRHLKKKKKKKEKKKKKKKKLMSGRTARTTSLDRGVGLPFKGSESGCSGLTTPKVETNHVLILKEMVDHPNNLTWDGSSPREKNK
jgi:hypothetical protein